MSGWQTWKSHGFYSWGACAPLAWTSTQKIIDKPCKVVCTIEIILSRDEVQEGLWGAHSSLHLKDRNFSRQSKDRQGKDRQGKHRQGKDTPGRLNSMSERIETSKFLAQNETDKPLDGIGLAYIEFTSSGRYFQTD